MTLGKMARQTLFRGTLPRAPGTTSHSRVCSRRGRLGSTLNPRRKRGSLQARRDSGSAGLSGLSVKPGPGPASPGQRGRGTRPDIEGDPTVQGGRFWLNQLSGTFAKIV